MTDSLNKYFQTINELFLNLHNNRTRNQHQVFQRLLIYRQILSGREKVLYDEKSLPQCDLLKFGFVVQRRRELEITSRIHSKCFDEEWIQRNLEQNDIYKRILYWAEDDRLIIDHLCHMALSFPNQMQQDWNEWVDELVRNHIVNGWENGNEQYHRSWIEVNNHFINHDPQNIRSALEQYKRILRGYELAFDNKNRIQQILLSSELLNNGNQRLNIAKRIYILAFNENWIQQKIERLPPTQARIARIIYIPPNTKFNTVVDFIKKKIDRFCRLLKRRFKRIWLITGSGVRYTISLAIVIFLIFLIFGLPLIYETIIYNNLQKRGEEVVSNFANSQEKQLESLSSSIKYGQELKNILKKNHSSLVEYPAISPIYALRYVIDNIYEKNSFSEHDGPVRSVNFAIDKSGDKFLASAGDDGSVRIWNLSNISKSKVILKGKIDQGIITSVNFFPTQKLITTIGNKKPIIKFWNLSGENIITNQELIYDRGEIVSAKFSPDGKILATIGGPNNLLKIWRINFDETAKEIRLNELSLQKKSNINLNNIYFSHNYKTNEYLVAILKNTSRIKLCKISVQEKEAVILDEIERDTQQQGIKNIIFSSDGKLMVSAAKDGTIKLWELLLKLKKISLEEKETISAKETKETKELNISISSDGELMAATGENGEIQLWRLTPKLEKIDLKVKLNANQGRIYSINFNPNNSNQDKIYLATGGEDKTVKLWEISKLYHQPFIPFSENIQDIGIGQISKEDPTQRLVILNKDGTVQLSNLDMQENPDFQSLKDSLGNIIAKKIAISPDRSRFAILYTNGTVKLWDFSKEEKLELPTSDKNLVDIILSSRNKELATVDKNGKATLRDFGGNTNTPLNYLRDEVSSVSFSHNNTIILTGNRKGSINLWSVEGKLIKNNFLQINSEVKSLKFTTDNNHIVIVGSNNKMTLWKLSNNISKNDSVPYSEKLFSKENVQLADFSPQDGEFANLVATADNGKLVKIWNFKGRQLAEFSGSWKETTNISFSPNGKYLVASGDNGTVERWEMKNLDSLLSEGCDWFKDHQNYEDYSWKSNTKRRDKDRICL